MITLITAATLAVYPIAGVPWQDVTVNNYVDLDPRPGRVLDFACGTETYDGHSGHDIDIRSFREQQIGVPVFAALDGKVVAIQDGFADLNHGSTRDLYDNHVVLEHPDGRQTVYGHLRRRSTTVRLGQVVTAGTQLGLVGSSGNSTWPHLHFTLRDRDEVFEPSAGPCRPGASGWALQPPTAAPAPYVREVALGARPFTGVAALPYDRSARTGTFVRGRRAVHVRVEAIGPATPRLRVLRPDGSVAAERVGGGPWRLVLDLRPGRWTLAVDLDGTRAATAPFRVVARAAEARNRPPARVAVAVDPAPVPRCVVSTSLVTEDPDYDVVRYRYRWTVAGRAVRTVTSAGLADAIPRAAVRPGDEVVCTVVPSDGRLAGPPATATARIP